MPNKQKATTESTEFAKQLVRKPAARASGTREAEHQRPRTPEKQDLQISTNIQETQEPPDLQITKIPKLQSIEGIQSIGCSEEELLSGDLPFHTFVQLAAERSAKNTWADVGMSATWEFVRSLKSRPEFIGASAEEAVEKIPWELTDFCEGDKIRFMREWDRVEFAFGTGPLEWAAQMAEDYPLPDPPGPKLQLYRAFVSLAGWLQILQGPKPILLPVEKLAPLLETSRQGISDLRAIAREHGLLTEVAPYVARVRATEFRFDVDRFPILKERQ